MSNTFNWTTCTVKDVVERHFCGPSPDCEERQIFAPEEWGVLKTTAITWTGWDEKAHKVLPRAFWGQAKIEVHAGDVLVTKAGPRNRVGVVCYVPSTRSQLVVSGKMIGLRPVSEAVNASFLAGLLATQEPQKHIHDRTTGMAESQVNFANEVLLSTPLRIPPIQEQNLIARVLDTLNTAIRETEAIIDKLKVVKQGLLQDLLTRGIDTNGELRPTQSEAPQLYKESPLGWIPREWGYGSLSNWLNGKPKNGYSPTESGTWTGVQMLGLACLTKEGFSPTQLKSAPVGDRGLEKVILETGDLLISRANTRDLVGLVGVYRDIGTPCTYPDLMMRLTPSTETSSNFLQLALQSPQTRRQIQAAASGTSESMVKISSAIVAELRVTIPPLEEQASILDRTDALVDRLHLEQEKLQKLRLNQFGLMDDLLTGRVRVTPLLEGAVP
jgi:type I restriction enzyme S subunit